MGESSGFSILIRVVVVLGILFVLPILIAAHFVRNFGTVDSTTGLIFAGLIWFVALLIAGKTDEFLARLLEGGTSRHVFRPGAEYPENWDEIRQEVLQRDGFTCGNCGRGDHLHVHHIVPLSVGGSNQISNLRTLCEDCHKRLHPHMRD